MGLPQWGYSAMVRQTAAYVSHDRPAWAFDVIHLSNDCPVPGGIPANQEMLQIIDFRMTLTSREAAKQFRLPIDPKENRLRTEMRWAWLRVDKTTGAGWVRVDHVYSPLAYRKDRWDQWYAAHDSEYKFVRYCNWVPLPEFIATYPRFQRMPNPEALDGFTALIEVGSFRSAPWWKEAPVVDETGEILWEDEREDAALIGESCFFDGRIWFKRVKQGNPERVLDSQAAYDEWWKLFG